MANIVLNPGVGGATLASDTAAGAEHQLIKIEFDNAGAPVKVSALNPLPVAGSFTGALPAGSAVIGKVQLVNSTGANLANVTAAGLLAIDGSGATQPVSGTVTANIGTSGTLAQDTTLTGGAAKAIVRGGTKGGSPAADVTSRATGADHQALDVAIVDASGNQISSFGGGSQYAQGVTQASPTGTVAMGKTSGNVLNALTLDASNNLNVNLTGGAVQALTDNAAFTPGTTQGVAFFAEVDDTGTTNVTENNAGAVRMTPARALYVSMLPGTTPASTRSRVQAAASTNSTSLKGSAGVVLGYQLANNTASAKFFKFYDLAVAPTVGTSTIAYTIIVPANTAVGAVVADFGASGGIPFGTGIGYGITGAIADADTTNTAVNDVTGFVLWK